MKIIYTKENKNTIIKIISETKKLLKDSDIKLKKIERSIDNIEIYINKNNVR